MKPYRSIRCLICLTLLSLGSGCASFRASQLPPVSNWPPQATASQKSISIVTTGQAIMNGKEVQVDTQFLNASRALALKAYRDSGLFSQVSSGLGTTDLRAEVRFVDNGHGSLAMAFLTGLTLYLIPSSATDELTVKTTIKDANGNLLGSFEKAESITQWQELFMVFAMAGHSADTVSKSTVYDLHRATITEAHANGLF